MGYDYEIAATGEKHWASIWTQELLILFCAIGAAPKKEVRELINECISLGMTYQDAMKHKPEKPEIERDEESGAPRVKGTVYFENIPVEDFDRLMAEAKVDDDRLLNLADEHGRGKRVVYLVRYEEDGKPAEAPESMAEFLVIATGHRKRMDEYAERFGMRGTPAEALTHNNGERLDPLVILMMTMRYITAMETLSKDDLAMLEEAFPEILGGAMHLIQFLARAIDRRSEIIVS